MLNKINQYIPTHEIYKTFESIAKTYSKNLIHKLMFVVNYTIRTSSTVFLVLIILFYLLKDGSDFKDKVIDIIPEKYKSLTSKTLFT
ncbi:MAG: AI-2E family transporter [Clostridium sp.]|uniref:AI-2E family transporter n=1 Tax=Clostridium sp. TaxID=1506 RepID=UPI003D6C93F4